MHFLIIGGSDAGISAALRARELKRGAEITVLLEDDFPNYSICGLPFYLSGETPDWHSLAHRTEFEGINVQKGHRAIRIDPRCRQVEVASDQGGTTVVSFDKLLIGTGARPIKPKLSGIDLPGVFFLHTMKDSFRVHEYLVEHRPTRAVIVGAGYIGLEMADALVHKGIEVTVASRTETVLATVDAPLGTLVGEAMEAQGVNICTGVEVDGIESVGSRLRVTGSKGFSQDCELVLIAVGVTPNAELGAKAGVPTGAKGALRVNRRMETGIPDVYAAGDCVETWHRTLRRNTYLPLGTTAHKQGRTAGENALGGEREFAGSLGTQSVKLFDLVIARTGLRQDEAEREQINAMTTETVAFDHKAYYPGARQMHIRVTGDSASGRLLGAQVLGAWGTEVSKRVDIFAAALFSELRIAEMESLDLSYTPPLSSPWDPVQMASQAWQLNHSSLQRS